MRFYKPLFSFIIIIVQLIITIYQHFAHENWRELNPELDELFHFVVTYNSLFIFVLIIGVCEMLTKPNWFKATLRVFIVCIVVGTFFSDYVPIEDFYFGVYNTAWFSAVVATLLILIKLGKYAIQKKN